MRVAWHWIRVAPGAEWHAWPESGVHSLCGVLRRQVVAAAVTAGTAAIAQSTPERDACPSCQGRVQWLRVIRHKLAAMRVGVVCEADQQRLAEYLARIGPPTSRDGRAAWARAQQSILRPSTRTVAPGKRVRRCWGLKPALSNLQKGCA